MGALLSATLGRASWAGGAIALAVIADTFDGRFARMFESDDTRKAIGGELDSLADAVVFGAVPVACAILLAGTSAPAARATLWISAFVYVACAITRLAFFNIHSAGAQTGFVGIPVPVAALTWASALLTHPSAVASASIIAVAAIAMVVPLRIARPTGAGLVLFTLWPVSVLLGHAGIV
jgi:phosphatidylserine synthase